MLVDYDLYFKCAAKATSLLHCGYIAGNIPHEELTELLVKLEMEKLEKDSITDAKLDYNDEIMAIEPAGDLETIDISVSGDNLFYCNGILTKNSFGLPATADFLFALVSTEDLEKLGQLMVKQLKNRWGDINTPRRFIIGIDRSKMKLFNAEESAQDGLMKESGAVMDNTPIGRAIEDESNIGKSVGFRKRKPNFGGLN